MPSRPDILAARQRLLDELGHRVMDTLGDDPLNVSQEKRLEEAQHHLDLEQVLTGADPAPDVEGPEEVAGDILANLLHHAIFHGWDFEAAVERARETVVSELQDEAYATGPGGR